VDGGHAKETATWRIGGQFDFAEFVTRDAFNAVIGGEQPVDKYIVALQQFAQPAVFRIAQQMGE
jgi:hypothetical protein